MPITKEELEELIEPKADIEKVSTISSDGKTFVTRIPKEVIEQLGIKKGNKIRWLVDEKNNELKIRIEDHDTKKEKNN
jgi:antitoxin component of MazEF toxin-antitoxin module